MPADEVLLNDPFQHGRIALPVPRTFGIDDGYRSTLADPEAVGLGSKNATLLGQTELLQPSLQEVPCDEAALFLTALGRRLIAAEKDVSPRNGNTDVCGNPLLRLLDLVSHQNIFTSTIVPASTASVPAAISMYPSA